MSSQTPAAYDDLLARYRRYANLEKAGGMLMWDQHVAMPAGGTPARSQQQSAIAASKHEVLTARETERLLDDLSGAALDDGAAANVREIRREYERAASVPADLVEELSRTQADAHEVWVDAKANDDFDAFAPTLERLLELHRERAAHIDPDADPFEVMFRDGEPYLPLSTVEEVFDDLREGLVPLIEEIRESGDELPSPFTGSFDAETQDALSRDALDAVGYDWERGRLDTSPHPFTFGTQFDARITTRYHEDDLLDALMATLHEFGHATYQLGLPRERYAAPLGQSQGSGLHESQSRFWENHVGRTRAFWELFLPTVKERFPGLSDVTVEEAYAAANRIDATNRIRVEADELTYHLHILLRFELERKLVAGDIEVSEVPRVWNDTLEEYLGIRPESDAAGCLQDVHWTSRFASFQNYTVGSVFAAQLDATVRDELDVDELVRSGEFDPLHAWLTENVHSHGRRYPTDELMRRATGESLTADHFLSYVDGKFTDLYGL